MISILAIVSWFILGSWVSPMSYMISFKDSKYSWLFVVLFYTATTPFTQYLWVSLFCISSYLFLYNLFNTKNNYIRIFLVETGFYLITNLLSWITMPNYYSRDFIGLFSCYAAGLPFYLKLLSGGLISSILFDYLRRFEFGMPISSARLQKDSNI